MSFGGFPAETLQFLGGIAAHNDKTWFDANRDLYERGYVEPARAFVDEIGPRLRAIAPAVQFSSKVNGSLSRINRDIRFSKDKRPYKEHLGLWFWHGAKRQWDVPGFWFELTPRHLQLGVGLYMLQGDALEAFRQSVIHPRSGRALLAAVAAVQGAGAYEFGGKSRKLKPRGFDTDADRVDYLLYEGLYVSTTLPPETATRPDLPDVAFAHYRNMWPIGQWLLDEVADIG
ncbi:MAG TPA: DUF2461 domain-containing protein [Devosia sp.]|jgi:uncharacterized protein (TIGR02453 family)|nr:DUF2461 domain-containing protein [Devosia sp.]